MGAPESARLLSHSPEYWLHHMGRERTLAVVLQLQHDPGLILSNLQVLGQFVTSLNRMSSEVMRVVFDREPFPTAAVQFVALSHCVRWAAHYLAAMGLWRPPSTQGIHSPAVVVLQRVHGLCRLFSGSSEVAVSVSCCVFPRGKVRGVVDIVFYVYFATPPALCY